MMMAETDSQSGKDSADRRSCSTHFPCPSVARRPRDPGKELAVDLCNLGDRIARPKDQDAVVVPATWRQLRLGHLPNFHHACSARNVQLID